MECCYALSGREWRREPQEQQHGREEKQEENSQETDVSEGESAWDRRITRLWKPQGDAPSGMKADTARGLGS